MEKNTQTPENLSARSLVAVTALLASILGLLEAIFWTFRGYPNSTGTAFLFLIYGSLGYVIFSTLTVLLIVLLFKKQLRISSNFSFLSVAIPVGVVVTILALSFLKGGVKQYLIFIPGSISLAIVTCYLLRKPFTRLGKGVSVGRALAIHTFILAFGTALIALMFVDGIWKWLALAVAVVGFLIALTSGISKEQRQPVRKLVLINLVLLLTIPAYRMIPGVGKSYDLPNILLITIDTLRPDHLGCYGYKDAYTPNIDRLAARGILFTNALSASPRTGPSHISMLTGLYQNRHGALRNGEKLSEKVVTLPEILVNNGYETAAFISGWTLKDEACGLAPRFQTYDQNFSPWKRIPEPTYKLRILQLLTTFGPRFGLKPERIERPAGMTTDYVINWLKKSHNKPFFLWVHFYDPHVPYDPPQQYRKMHLKNPAININSNWWGWKTSQREEVVQNPELHHAMIELYDGEISYVDAEIARLETALNNLNLSSNTIRFITSDHGESLGEHDHYFGHDDLYETCLRVPLIMVYPNSQWSHQKIDSQTQLVDFTPSVLDLLGIHSENNFDGHSFLTILDSAQQTGNQPAFASLLENKTDMFAVRQNGYKLIYTAPQWGVSLRRPARQELYYLPDDPNELNNIFDKKPPELTSLTKMMKQWSKEKYQGKQSLNEEARKKLRSLGYIK